MEHLRIHAGSVTHADDARRKYRRLKRLIKVVPRFVDPVWDTGPFMLRCEGMRFGNMLVDVDYNITAVLDWEWSYTAPMQMLYSPPRWLIIRRPMQWNIRAPREDYCFARYIDCFARFVEILAEEEHARAQLWPSGKTSTSDYRLARLMRDSLESGILWFHELLLAPSAHDNEAVWEKVEQLVMEEDENPEVLDKEVEDFVDWKMRQLQDYQQQRGNVDVVEDPRKSLLRVSFENIVDAC